MIKHHTLLEKSQLTLLMNFLILNILCVSHQISADGDYTGEKWLWISLCSQDDDWRWSDHLEMQRKRFGLTFKIWIWISPDEWTHLWVTIRSTVKSAIERSMDDELSDNQGAIEPIETETSLHSAQLHYFDVAQRLLWIHRSCHARWLHWSVESPSLRMWESRCQLDVCREVSRRKGCKFSWRESTFHMKVNSSPLKQLNVLVSIGLCLHTHGKEYSIMGAIVCHFLSNGSVYWISVSWKVYLIFLTAIALQTHPSFLASFSLH